MTSKIVVNNIEADSGVSTVTFGSEISASKIVTSSGEFTVGTGATIFSPSSNTLTLGTNNAERVRITSSGNVGIGTDTPTANLEVKRSDNGQVIKAKIIANQYGDIRLESEDSGTPNILIGYARNSGNYGTNTTAGDFSIKSSSARLHFPVGAGNASSVMIMADTGHVTIPNGNLVFSTSGTGIDFSATSDASESTSELLDDYEEGTWTPVLYRSSTAPTVTYSTNRQKGRYTKIGNVVTIWFDVDWTSLTGGSGDPIIGGLPYNVVAVTTQAGYGIPSFRNATGVSVDFRIYGNSSYFSSPSYIYLRHYNSSGTELATTFNSSGRLTGWGQYFTNNAY